MQYKFLYQAVREMIICDDTFIAVRDFNQVSVYQKVLQFIEILFHKYKNQKH